MADISAALAQFSTFMGESVTALFSLLSNLATFFALATGLASLFFGRRLFWVFVATIGFIIGTHVAPLIYPYLPEVMAPFNDVIGLAIALVLAGTAIVMQRFATIIFGALAMGIVGYLIAGSADSIEWVQWFFTGLFALSGGLLLYFFFDWTLILVSVLVGSAIAIFGARATGGIPDDYGLWLFGLLLAAGIIYQGNDLRISHRLRQSSASRHDGTARQDGIPTAQIPGKPAQSNFVAPAPTPFQGTLYSSTSSQGMPQQAKPHSNGNTVMVPLKPKPAASEQVQRSYQPDFAPLTASMLGGAAAAHAPEAPAPAAVPNPAPSVAATPAPAPYSAPRQSTVQTPTPTKRVELFPGYPQASFGTPTAVKESEPSIYSAEYESVAPAFPPTFATRGYAQTDEATDVFAVAQTKPTVTPESIAPSLNTQGSMSFSDLWKWTPWRKSDDSGTVSGTKAGNASSNDTPYRSSPDALG